MPPDHALSRLFSPDSIALVGASADAKKLSGRPQRFLSAHDYPGDVFLVNPGRDEIDGVPCYDRVTDLPQPVDVALVLVPAPHVAGVIEECGAHGIPFAVVIASGFAETGPEGERRQAELVEVAREANVRLVGPNSEGFINLPDRVAASFSSILRRDDLRPGSVGFVTQSGAFGGALFQLTQDRDLGTSVWVSTGNEAGVDTLDILAYLVDDPETAVIVAYIESLREGQRLLDIGRRAAVNGTTIVAMRVGASERGGDAVASHTGSVATADTVYDGVFRQAGVLRVRSVDACLDTVSAVSHLPATIPTGELAVVSISGGAAALAADAAERLDVSLATLAEDTVAAIEREIPAYGSAKNPLDVTAAAMSDHAVFERCITTVADDSAVGTLLIQFGNSGREMVETFAQTLLTLGERADVLVATVFLGSAPRAATRRRLTEGGVLTFEDPVRAVATVGQLHRLRAARARLSEPTPPPPRTARRPMPTTWPALRDALADCGVPFVETVSVESAAEAVEAATELGHPVVLKQDPLAVVHKTESGGVHTGLTDAAAVETAFDALASAGEPIVCQRQVTGVEALVGVVADPDFGPVLTLGPGGVFVELFDAFAARALPVTAAEADTMVAETPLARLLSGYRGVSGNRDALCALAAGLSRFVVAYDVSTVECNPVVVTDSGAMAVDLLFE